MPSSPLHPCGTSGCAALLPRGVSRCQAHAKPASQGWNPNAPRIRGSRLQADRKKLFTKQPLCVECLKVERYTVATIRDHIVPLAEGGLDIEENTQPLCQACSDTKTRAEALRGRRR